MKKLISIVIPVYNTPEEFLETALESVITQKYNLSKVEIIIVLDGVSINDSIFLKFKGKIDIILITLPKNIGISSARNQAIKLSSANYILLLDADDAITENCLNEFEKAIKGSAKKANIIFSNSLRYNSTLTEIEREIDSKTYFSYFNKFQESIFNPLFHSIFIGHCIVLQKDFLVKCDYFNQNYRFAEITDLMLNLYIKGAIFFHVDSFLYKYRNNPLGLSKSGKIKYNRIKSIKKYFKIKFKSELSSIKERGKVLPFNHTHYDLYLDNQLIRLPYLIYEESKVI